MISANFFKFRPKNGLNFGDELGPLICQQVLREKHSEAIDTNCDGNIFSVGSVLHFTQHGDTVWGSGINGKVPLPIDKIAKDYRAVRGKLTYQYLVEKGFDVPQVFGDPAILVSRYFHFTASALTCGKILVIPNYNDFAYLSELVNVSKWRDEIFLVHPFTPYQVVIELILGSKGVVTSSLHALLFSDLYKKPNSLLNGENFKEHPFKYLDYVSSLDLTKLNFYASLDNAISNLSEPRKIPQTLIEGLVQAFPVDKLAPANK